MKIVMVAPTPFMADRGCHTQILLEIMGLQRLGHHVILCTYGLGRDVPGVTIVRCFNPAWYKKLSAGPSYTKILLLPILTWTALRTIARYHPDVVHAHLHEGGLIAIFCRIFFRKPLYLMDMQGALAQECVQHKFIRQGGLFYKILIWIEKIIVNTLPIITQADSMIQELIQNGAPIERIANVKDGVDTELFRPRPFDTELAQQLNLSPSRPRILFVGLLETYQGSDLMFQAFAQVAKQIPDVQFIVIGYPNIEKYRKLCSDLGILENTLFLGRIDYFQLPRYLSLSDIGVAPKISLTEGDGKIYNYMAMGMCTVAFERDVSREILDDCGVYAKMGDPKDLAEKLTQTLFDTSLKKSLGEKSRIRAVAELSWISVGKRIEAFYLRQLSNKSTGTAYLPLAQ